MRGVSEFLVVICRMHDSEYEPTMQEMMILQPKFVVNKCYVLRLVSVMTTYPIILQETPLEGREVSGGLWRSKGSDYIPFENLSRISCGMGEAR